MTVAALSESAEYEAFCAGRLADPYPLLDQLRENDPVHWSDRLSGWVLTRYEDVLAAIFDRRLASDRVAINMSAIADSARPRYRSLEEHVSNWLGFTDPPKHTRMRKLSAQAFSPALAERLRPRIEELVTELLDEMAAADRVDLVADLAFPVPSTVICEILGIPSSWAADFQGHTGEMVAFVGNVGPTLANLADGALHGHRELDRFFASCLRDRRDRSQDDLLTALAGAEDNGAGLSETEILGLCTFLYVAGHETTVALLANAAWVLMQHPEQAEVIRRDPTVLPAAIEETLRYESPIQLNTRLATSELEIGGKRIDAGDTVILHLGAANRDPERFAAPDEFDTQRPNNRHLAFGWAAHFCLGAPLARLEAQAAIGRLLDRFELTPARDPIRWRESMTLRCPEALPVVPVARGREA
jgi:pimeloyl-[acyl-carrier protein] synthase